MRTIHTLAWVFALAAADDAGAQLSPFERQRQERQDREQQELLERAKTQSVPPAQFPTGPEMPRQPLLEMPKIKPAPLEARPLERGATKPRPQAAPSAPPPSRVVYGETRKLSGARELPQEDAPKPSAKSPAAKPPAVEKPPCVYKPVMTDADMAACR